MNIFKQWLVRKLGGIVINDLPLHIQVKIFEHYNNQEFNRQMENNNLRYWMGDPKRCDPELKAQGLEE